MARLQKEIAPILLLFVSTHAFGWGAAGHKIAIRNSKPLISSESLKNCSVTLEELIEHTNDPDSIWRNKRIQFPHEDKAHYFHVENQPKNWKELSESKVMKEGQLVYRIVSWIEESKKLRKKKKWNDLKTKLYGISHYIGDLTQPLHLTSDYDGKASGIPGLHSQYETKMVNRFEKEIDSMVSNKITAEKIPAHWAAMPIKDLIFNIAEQSNQKAPALIASSKNALVMPKTNRRRKPSPNAKPRFVKKELFAHTRETTKDQLGLASQLFAHVFGLICR